MSSLKGHPRVQALSSGSSSARQYAKTRPQPQPDNVASNTTAAAERVALYGRCRSPKSAITAFSLRATPSPSLEGWAARNANSPSSDRSGAAQAATSSSAQHVRSRGTNGKGALSVKVTEPPSSVPCRPALSTQAWLAQRLGIPDPMLRRRGPSPHSMNASLCSAGVGSSKPSKTASSDETAVVRAQDRLFDLINGSRQVLGKSQVPVFDDDSRPSYHRFIQGYVKGSTSKHPASQSCFEDAVTEIIGEDCHRLDLYEKSSRFEDGEEDHYSFFARCAPPAEEVCANREDNERRLYRARMQFLRERMPLQSWHTNGPSGGANLDNSDDPYAWQRGSIAAPAAPSKTPLKDLNLPKPPPVPAEASSSSDEEFKKEIVTVNSRRGLSVSIVLAVSADHKDEDNVRTPPDRTSANQASDTHDHETKMASHGPSFPKKKSLSRSFSRSQTSNSISGEMMLEETVAGESVLEIRRRSRKSQTNSNSAAAAAALKAEMRTREACESLRVLVFGYHTDDKRTNGAFYDQSCGSKEEIMQLFKVWNQMDEDGSGDIEFQEFLNFFSKSKADRLLGMRCVKYLVGSGMCEAGDGDGPAGCRIEDMMRLIWLKATKDDVDTMMFWFREAEFKRDRASTPPLLPTRKKREILDNFPMLERGEPVTLHDLSESGLVEESTMTNLAETCDSNGITEDKVLEMLCPNGYRAMQDAISATDSQGCPLEWICNEYYTGWIHKRRVEIEESS